MKEKTPQYFTILVQISIITFIRHEYFDHQSFCIYSKSLTTKGVNPYKCKHHLEQQGS